MYLRKIHQYMENIFSLLQFAYIHLSSITYRNTGGKRSKIFEVGALTLSESGLLRQVPDNMM